MVACRTFRTAPDTHGNRDNGALSSLNILKNDIGPVQAQALIKIKKEKKMVTLCGLKQDQTEADFSKQGLKPEDAILIAEDIKDKGALSKFTFSGDRSDSKPVTVEVGMTELDCSGAILQAPGAMILAAWIQHK